MENNIKIIDTPSDAALIVNGEHIATFYDGRWNLHADYPTLKVDTTELDIEWNWNDVLALPSVEAFTGDPPDAD